MTIVITLDPVSPDQHVIQHAAALLRAGRLVAFPTETVYGLGANACDAAAVERIFVAKGRPATDPLIVHVADLDMIDQVALALPPLAELLGKHFWPGPLTLILRRSPTIPPSVSAGKASVAVRIPAHPIALALIRAAGVPIAAPSANRFSRPSPTTAQHVFEDLDGRIDLILDGGPTAIGVESTILDLSSAQAEILRPGGVSLEALREVLPNVSYTPRYLGTETTATAPGSLLKHYSPRAELLLITGQRNAALRLIQTKAQLLINQRQVPGILVPEEDLAVVAGLPAQILTLGPERDLDAIAHALFANIRELDRRSVDTILVRGLSQTGLGLAIWDRLVRAAIGRVIDADKEQ